MRSSNDVIPVPFIDLRPVHETSKHRLLASISDIIDRGSFSHGSEIPAFEEAFASYCGTRFCVGVSSGLDALRLSLIGLGLKPGDEVIVPANTFVATYEAVAQAGGVPVPVDVTERDYNLDVAAAEAAITNRTAAILPVHLYGQLADMAALRPVVARHGLHLLEDAAQAHGARRDGWQAGAGGTAAGFSFYPAKNLGAIGDAGAVVTDDEGLARRVRSLREHGQHRKYRHEMQGFTARLDTVQAAVLLEKLAFLGGWNAMRRAAAGFYTAALDGVGDLALPPVPAGSDPVWHLYVVRTQSPERLAEFLSEAGIETGRHYPEPPHLSPAFRELGHAQGSFPVTEALSDTVLSLPIFPGITDPQLHGVVRTVADFFDHA